MVLEQNLKPEDLKRKLERGAASDPTVKSWLENMTFDSSGYGKIWKRDQCISYFRNWSIWELALK